MPAAASENVIPIHQDTTIAGLRKRAELLGMALKTDEHWPNIKLQIEALEAVRKVG